MGLLDILLLLSPSHDGKHACQTSRAHLDSRMSFLTAASLSRSRFAAESKAILTNADAIAVNQVRTRARARSIPWFDSFTGSGTCCCNCACSRGSQAASSYVVFQLIHLPQDPLGQMGLRLENSSMAPTQTWYRVLANGDMAVALYNKQGAPQVSIEPWLMDQWSRFLLVWPSSRVGRDLSCVLWPAPHPQPFNMSQPANDLSPVPTTFYHE